MNATATDDNVCASTDRPQHFEYVRIGVEFPDKLAQLLHSGDSVVLLGPRGIGKHSVLTEVKRRIRNLNEEHVLEIQLAQHRSTTLSGLLTSIVQSLQCLAPLKWTPPDRPEDLPGAVRRFLEKTPCHLILFASDVDELPDNVARRLLKELRILISLSQSLPGRLTVLLTGSADLAPLVYGADSEFTCAHQYVIQGFDQAVFAKHIDQLRSPNGWKFDDAAACLARLHQHCGGHIYLLPVIFSAILDERRIRAVAGTAPVTVEEIDTAVDRILTTGTGPVDLVVRAFARLETSVEAFSIVPLLLRQGQVDLPKPAVLTGAWLQENPPTEIELSGLAIRFGGKLRFASPLMELFTRHFLSDWTIGDYFACNYEWHGAFMQYLNAEQNGQPWVCSSTQRPRLRTALRAFETALFGVATRHTESLELLNDFFVTGARFFLGFDEISFWEHDGSWHQSDNSAIQTKPKDDDHGQPQWRMVVPTDQSIPRDTLTKCRSILPPVEILKDGLHSIEGDVNHPYAILLGLPAKDREPRKAVVLSNFVTQAPLTRDRRAFCEQVLKTYCGAYTQARSIEKQARNTRIQHHLLEAIPAVLKAVSGKPVTTKAAFEAAAERLREIGYRRVMFSMIDRASSRIVGVFDSRRDGEPDVAAMTDFPVASSMREVEDVQQHVALTGEILRISDARRYPSTKKSTVFAAEMRAIVILPIRHSGSVIGTMHVERIDRTLPQSEEIAALEYFVDQLATVIGLTARFEMLETAMNLQPDAVVLLDEQRRLRYANREAVNLTPVEPGWQNEDALKSGLDVLPEKVLDVFNEACMAKHDLRRYLGSDASPEKWTVVHVAPIRDWRDAQAGGILQIQDLKLMKRILESLKRLAACRTKDDLLDAILEAIDALGHGWARLYLIDERTGALVGQRQFGFQSGSEGAEMFAQGCVRLPSRDESENSWLCIDRERPVIFSTDPNREDGEEYMSYSGLRILNVSDPNCPSVITRKPGETWIDVPVYCREHNKPLGKLSVNFPEDYSPEQFERLRIHAEVASALLVAIIYREEQATRETMAMEKAIGETAHQLLSKLASLGTLTYRYRVVGNEPEEIAAFTKELDRRLEALHNVLQGVRDRLHRIEADRKRGDLAELIRQTLVEQLGEGAFDVRTDCARYPADFDEKLIEACFEELIMNASKAARAEKPLYVIVEMSSVIDGGHETCRIRFCDNGPGIKKELRQKVFDDLFSQWPGKQRGSGIGLGFVRRIIESHAGTIHVAESDEGACFVIDFPRFESTGERTEDVEMATV